MSKRNETPTAPTPAPRLIPVGGAKARTNSGGGSQVDEIDPLKPYDPA